MKDLFSADSDKYKSHRPHYPDALVKWICSLPVNRHRVWDCGAGSGQLTAQLAAHFDYVEGTDISANQLSQAPRTPHVNYSVQPAEKTNFPEKHFDLITVAQAIHWFNFEDFHTEVRRVLKPDGIIAVIGYGLCRVDESTDPLIDTLYKETLGSYWDPERRYIDAKYQTIPFPFSEMACPEFEMAHHWTLEEFIGYLSTWSALKHYMAETKKNPLIGLQQQLLPLWGSASRKVRFDLLLRVGVLQ